MSDHFVHEHALCESTAIGPRTRVWAFAHVLEGAVIGSDCNVCDHAYVEGGVTVGNRVTVKNRVLLFDGVTIEDDVFLGPGVIFTNDFRPRAEIRKTGAALATTTVERGATLGAGVTVVCGVTIGTYAFVGAGAVVTKSLLPHGIYVGNPAKLRGWACACGEQLDSHHRCACGRTYAPAGPDVGTSGLSEVVDE